MSDSLFLALAHIRANPLRSAVLVVLVALILAVPAVLQTLLGASERQMMARAQSTPLIIGRTGSQIDLTMKALYFSDDSPALISTAEENAVWDSGFADAVPLYVRFKAQGAPVVGTSIDYFDFRGLTLASGRRFGQLGEAVVGANLAARLGLAVGDGLLSDPENLFDLGGSYPLSMDVVGVLAKSGTVDDDAVIVDVKTAWVIEGLGHGHDDVVSIDASGEVVQAAAGILQFNRITPENIGSFHFHGAASDFPLTAVIARPYDKRAETILRGRYLAEEQTEQAVLPARVVADLLAQIVQIKRLIDLVLAVVALATFMALGLVVYLSAQMRTREGQTAFMLGAPRGLIWRLISIELVLLFGLAAIIAALLAITVGPIASGQITTLIA